MKLKNGQFRRLFAKTAAAIVYQLVKKAVITVAVIVGLAILACWPMIVGLAMMPDSANGEWYGILVALSMLAWWAIMAWLIVAYSMAADKFEKSAEGTQ